MMKVKSIITSLFVMVSVPLFACPEDPCEAEQSVFNWKEPISMYAGQTDTSSNNVSMLLMVVSDDLESLVSESNVTFLHPSTEIAEKMVMREDPLFGTMVHEWPKSVKDIKCKDKLFSLDVSTSSDDVKTLTLVEKDSNTGVMLRKYVVTGGYKKDDSATSKFVSKASLSGDYFYEIIVNAEKFNRFGSTTKKMRLWERYNANGTPSENKVMYDIDGERVVMETKTDVVKFKNSGLPESEYKRKHITVSDSNAVRKIEKIFFFNKEVIKDSKGVASFGKKERMARQLTPVNTVEVINPKLKDKTGIRHERSLKKFYLTDQNCFIKNLVGRVKTIYENEKKWTLTDFVKYDGSMPNDHYEIVYTPRNGAKLSDTNGDGEIDVKDLKNTPVRVKSSKTAEFVLKTKSLRKAIRRPKEVVYSDAIASWDGQKVVLTSEKKLSESNVDYQISADGKSFRKILAPKSTSRAKASRTSTVYTMSSSRISEIAPQEVLYEVGDKKVFENIVSGKTINASSFLNSSGTPNYSNPPTYTDGSDEIHYTLTGVESSSDFSVILPWASSSSTFLSFAPISGKTILSVQVKDSQGYTKYSSEYVYINSAFYPISWTYYTYDSYKNTLGEYQSNGLYSQTSYSQATVDGKIRYIATETDFFGTTTETGYEDSEMEKLLYTRKIGVASQTYGTFNDMLTTNVGSLANFAQCGCSSAISGTGDALISNYNTNVVGGSGDSITNATLLYQTYQYNEEENKPTVSIDSYGVKSTFTYSTEPATGNSIQNENRAGYSSAYKTTVYDTNGQPTSVTGAGVVAQYYTYNDSPTVGNRSETVRTGSTTSARFETTYYENYGEPDSEGKYPERIIRVDTPTSITTTSYDASGNISMTYTYAPNLSEESGTRTIYTYDIMGNSSSQYTQFYNITTSSWETIGDITTNDTSYVLENSVLWKVETSTINGKTSITRNRCYNTPVVENNFTITDYSISSNSSSCIELKDFIDRTNKVFKSQSISKDSVSQNIYSVSENVLLNGHQVESSTKDVNGNLKNKISTNYDNAGRVFTKDTISGNISYTEKNFFYPTSTVSLAPQSGSITVQGRLKAVSVYNDNSILGRKAEYFSNSEANSGQIKKLIYATSFDSATKEPLSGNRVIYELNNLGLVSSIWGYEQIPAKFVYDIYGQMTDMYLFKLPPSDLAKWNGDTWPSDVTISNANAERTKWEYNNIGQLVNKTDALGKVQSATYGNFGRTASITYPDSSNFSYTYDALGRPLAETFTGGSIAYNYDSNDNITQVTETLSDNTVQTYSYVYGSSNSSVATIENYPDGWKLERNIDANGNITGVVLKDSNGTIKYQISYTYNANNQLQSLSAESKTISYVRNADETINNINLNNLANINYTYDNIGRLTSMNYMADSSELYKNVYTLGVDEKISATTVNKNNALYGQWRYTYENLSSGLLTAKFYKDSNATTLFDNYSDYSFTYDTAGNPYSESNAGGITYTSSLNNQTTAITRANNTVIPIRGTQGDLSISVNDNTVFERSGSFCYSLPGYSSTPKYENIKIEASIDNGIVKKFYEGKKYIPEANEVLTYTDSGNLASDSRWTYTWNARQRLASIETSAQAVSVGVPKVKYIYTYNWKGLKVKSQKYTWDSTNNSWILYSSNYRYYDEHNLIFERTEFTDTTKSPIENKFYYGLDLLDSLYGTAGTGGVRLMNLNGQVVFPFNNITGNIEALLSANDGKTVKAEYEYSPFGEIRKQRGALASNNPLKFSSRFQEVETDLYYYSYRHYSPHLKKWLSMDSAKEIYDYNLNMFVKNDIVNYIDNFGKFAIPIPLIYEATVYTATILAVYFATKDSVRVLPAPEPEVPRECNPCSPKVGTGGYELHTTGRPHYVLDLKCKKLPHYHLYKVHQRPIYVPYDPCKCEWLNLRRAYYILPPNYPYDKTKTPVLGGGIL